MSAVAFDPDTTATPPRRMPTPAEVMRDLLDGGQRARRVGAGSGRGSRPRRERLRLDGLGEAGRPGTQARPATRSLQAIGAHAIALEVGLTIVGVDRAMRRVGAVKIGKEPIPGGGRPRTIWGMPEALSEAQQAAK